LLLLYRSKFLLLISFLYIPPLPSSCSSYSTSSTPFPSLHSPSLPPSSFLLRTLFYFRLSFLSSLISSLIRILFPSLLFFYFPSTSLLSDFSLLPPSYSPVSPSICPDPHSCALWT
jgi:hypothetical protein